MIRVAVFASGEGSNAERIFSHFKNHSRIEIKILICNKPDAPVIQKAKDADVQTLVVNRKDIYDSEKLLLLLQGLKIDWMVLAGFLWMIPENLIHAFPNRIINIHPALLPKYGGKGMFGMNVHRAIKDAGEPETGISIHLVNENYDEGKILFQQKIAIEENDSPEMIQQKVRKLELENYSRVVEETILNS